MFSSILRTKVQTLEAWLHPRVTLFKLNWSNATPFATQAAAAVADAERLQRAAAAGEADALRADADRRAKAFNTAVAAAVGRVKAGLEAERDALAAR